MGILLRKWIFRSTVVISTYELMLFVLWFSRLLPIMGDSAATTFMRVGQIVAAIGGITSLVSMFTRTVQILIIAYTSLFICLLSFCWLAEAFWIGSM